MHRILRQVVEVEVQGSPGAALALQRQIGDLCREAAAARLEAALAFFDPGDALVVIDRLDVDLGDVRPERLEAALTDVLASAVAAGLRDRGWTPGARRMDGRPVAGLGRTEAVLQAVLHFLRHGRLPWWSAREETSLEGRLLAVLASEPGGCKPGTEPRRSFAEALRKTLRGDARARERLLLQFSASTLFAVLDLLDPDVHRLLWRVLRSSRIPASGALRHRTEASLIETALHAAAGAIPAEACASEESLFETAALRLAARLTDGERGTLAALFPIRAGAEPLLTPVTAPVRDESVVEDGLPVEDAGLVLLHPFLPQFLVRLGIAEEDALLQPSRATLLLHHLATGACTVEEHALVLAKVLCGILIEAPVPREAPVTPEEQAEAEALLESVVRHWTVLRGTSADGLRGNFLARSGRLELREGDWVLRVERRSHDVLLESLPWGVAHVKLPWMPRLMHVEWAP